MVKPTDGASPHGPGEGGLGFHTIVTTFKEETTAHGIPHVHKAKGAIKITFWTIISLAATLGLIWNGYHIINQYLSFGVSVSVFIESERILNFPAVTLCNHNPIKLTKFEKTPELMSLLNNYTQGKRKKRDLYEYEGLSQTARYMFYEHMHETVADMSETEKLDLGYTLDEMILGCEFNGYPCNMTTDFSQLYDPTYGNCYIYNWGKTRNIKKLHKPGARHGLSITFNLDQRQYVSELTESAGLRVLVHPQTSMPFPLDEGMSVSAGELTYYAVRKEDYSRLPAPYGPCYTSSSKDLTLNAYAEKFDVDYTTKACYNTCYQSHLINICDCGDGMYPRTGEAFGNKNVSVCKTANASQVTCEAKFYRMFIDGTLECNCNEPCKETQYIGTGSPVSWPAYAHMANLEARYGGEPLVQHLFANGSTDFKSNLGKIVVYFEEFDHQSIQESAAYTFGSLVSDVGGILGLYLGFSSLTILEFFVLAGDLLAWNFRYIMKKEMRQNTPKDEGIV